MTEFYNRTAEKEKRRVLRREMTQAELRLWWKLKNKQLGASFRRQYSVGPYIVDFYCPAAKLAIEIDGSIHLAGDNPQYDCDRHDYIERFGVRFLRFTNEDILHGMDGVLGTIRSALASNGPTTEAARSSPPYEGGVGGGFPGGGSAS